MTKRLTDKEFAAAVRLYVDDHGADFVKKVEDGLRALGTAASSRRIVDAVDTKGSGLILVKSGRGRKVCPMPAFHSVAPAAPAPGEAARAPERPAGRMPAFGEAIARLGGTLPPGCKLSLTVELNGEALF